MTYPHHNELTPAEHERLSILIEECGEVIQAIGKIMKHGYNSTHPETSVTNRDTLETEISHVLFAVNYMMDRGDIDAVKIATHHLEKKEAIKPYLHHQFES